MNAFAVRFLVASLAVAAAACGGKKSSPPPAPAAYRFLPANPSAVVRVDLARLRAWPHYQALASKALGGVEPQLASLREHCQLDVFAEAKDMIFAMRGQLLGGDFTLIASGLPKDKVTSCMGKLAASTVVKPTLDGDLVQIKVGEHAIASGAILPSGDIVLVAREGKGIEPGAWKTEVSGTGTAPAWVTELDATAPLAARVHDEERTVLLSTVLGEPLVVKGKVVSPTTETAQREAKNLGAVADYLKKGDAGEVRVEPKGTTTFLDLTASGKQVENFIRIVMPTLTFVPPPMPADPNAPPPDCSALAPAVKAYLDENLAKAPASNKPTLESQMPKLLPALQEAFVSSCTADKWAAAAIECHVTNASALARFEKCRQMLPDDQRGRLDQAVAAALSAK